MAFPSVCTVTLDPTLPAAGLSPLGVAGGDERVDARTHVVGAVGGGQLDADARPAPRDDGEAERDHVHAVLQHVLQLLLQVTGRRRDKSAHSASSWSREQHVS